MTDRASKACLVIAALLVASGMVHLGVFVVDERPWHGPVSWRKPFTFGVSFGLTLASVAWVTSYLQIRPRSRALLLSVFAADCVLEVAGITVQAWRNQPSHLNTTTSTNTIIAMLLAFGGLVLIVTLGAFAAPALLGRTTGSASMVLAVRAGFALLVVGLLSGAARSREGRSRAPAARMPHSSTRLPASSRTSTASRCTPSWSCPPLPGSWPARTASVKRHRRASSESPPPATCLQRSSSSR